MDISAIIAVVIAAFLLAKTLKISSKKILLRCGLIWAAEGLILDLLITMRFTGSDYFNSWLLWLGYLILLATPILAAKKERQVISF